MTGKKYYAVIRGRKPGIYTAWFGKDGAEAQVKGFRGARYRGFKTRQEAEEAIAAAEIGAPSESRPSRASRKTVKEVSAADMDVVMYTDGGCRFNPGPGGYGVVIQQGGKEIELSAGFELTTNNRMELLACIEGLRQVPEGRSVLLHSDSQYVVNGIELEWAKNWRRKNWMKTRNEAALNADLWKILLELVEAREVQFVWVKGHAGNPGNERCDQLATAAALQSNLGVDKGYCVPERT